MKRARTGASASKLSAANAQTDVAAPRFKNCKTLAPWRRTLIPSCCIERTKDRRQCDFACNTALPQSDQMVKVVLSSSLSLMPDIFIFR